MVIAFAPSEKMWEKETVCVCVWERDGNEHNFLIRKKSRQCEPFPMSEVIDLYRLFLNKTKSIFSWTYENKTKKKKDKKSPFLIVTSLHHQPSIFSLLHTSTYKSPKQPAQHLPLYIMTYLSCLYISTYLSCLYIFLAFFLFRCFDWSFCKSSLAFLGTANPLGEKKGSKI